MTRSVIVYGPQGCGKTLFAKELAVHLGLHSIVEGEGLTLKLYQLAQEGTLFLTHERPAWTHDDDRRVVDFFALLKPAGLLYDPRLIHRDSADGTFLHPHLPAWESPSGERDEDDITPLVTEQGFVLLQVEPGTEFPDGEAYWEFIKDWEPAPPSSDSAWRLAAVLDTDNGPRAWYVRPINPINQTDQE